MICALKKKRAAICYMNSLLFCTVTQGIMFETTVQLSNWRNSL